MILFSFLQSSKQTSSKGPLHQLLSGRTSSDGQSIKPNSLGRNVASFDAKFAAVPIQTDSGGGGGGVASGRGLAGSGSTPTVLSGSNSMGSTSDDADHTILGNWELLWENCLQKCEYVCYLFM